MNSSASAARSGDEAEGLTEETGIPLDVWLAGLLLIGAVFFVGSARLQAKGRRRERVGSGEDGRRGARGRGHRGGVLCRHPEPCARGHHRDVHGERRAPGVLAETPDLVRQLCRVLRGRSRIIAFAVDALVLGNPALTNTLSLKAVNTSILGWRVPIIGEVLGFAGFGFGMFRELLTRVPIWNYSYLPFDNPVTAFIRVLLSVPTTVGLGWVVWVVFSGTIGGSLRRG